MEKNDIITLILVILNMIVLYKIYQKYQKNESYDTGYNQITTFRDTARKFKI